MEYVMKVFCYTYGCGCLLTYTDAISSLKIGSLSYFILLKKYETSSTLKITLKSTSS